MSALPHSVKIATQQQPAKCWAALIASGILFPANMLPISVIYVNGARQEDTILSGIISLAHSNVGSPPLFSSPVFWCPYQSGGDVYAAYQHSL